MTITQVAQRATDLNRAVEFYMMLLGQPVSAAFDPPGLAFFRIGETRLLLDVAAPTALIYFGVDDVRTRIEELRGQSVAIVSEPHVIFHHDDDTIGPADADEWMAFITDSEGNTVGLTSWHAAGAGGAGA
jgi:methylmalonyl-CoA/ethylmalonyl-CoA epimerase